MKHIFFIISLLLTLNLLAQNSPYTWGVFTDEEIQMEVYEKDSSAAAVVLGEWGRFQTVDEDRLKTLYSYHHRKKILAKDGLEVADVVIQFYHDIYSVSKFKAQTLNYTNGNPQISFLETKDFVRRKINDDVSEVRFTFDKAKVGSIIEYKYQLKAKNIVSLQTWHFQGQYPVIESIYEGFINKYLSYVFMIQNAENIEAFESKNSLELKNIWKSRNLPAMKKEDFMPNISDYYTAIKFQLAEINWPGRAIQTYLSDWQNLSIALLYDFDYGMQLNKKVLKHFPTDISNKTLPAKTKVEKVFNHIVNNYKWNDEISLFPDVKIKELLEVKTGNGTALNFLLINALKELNIEVYPVLISTLGNGLVYDRYPFTRQFDHTIVCVKIGEEEILLDATANTRPFDMIPLRDINSVGYLVQKKKADNWVNLRNVQSGNHTCSINGTLDEKGVFSGTFTYLEKGYEGYLMREALVDQTNEEYFAEKMETENGDFTIDEILVENLEDVSQAVKSKIKLQSPEFVSVINDFMYFSPMLNEGMDENPFQLKERQYPIDFIYPQNETYVLNLALPAGYEVESIPDQLRMTLPDKSISFSYNVNITEQGGIQILNRFNIKRSYFAPEEYEGLKDFFNMIVEKHAEQIVLKKM